MPQVRILPCISWSEHNQQEYVFSRKYDEYLYMHISMIWIASSQGTAFWFKNSNTSYWRNCSTDYHTFRLCLSIYIYSHRWIEDICIFMYRVGELCLNIWRMTCYALQHKIIFPKGNRVFLKKKNKTSCFLDLYNDAYTSWNGQDDKISSERLNLNPKFSNYGAKC